MPILVDHQLSELVNSGSVKISRPNNPADLIRPASIDLPISIRKIYRVSAEPDLSDGIHMEEWINYYGRHVPPTDKSVQLDRGSVYVARLSLDLKLDRDIFGVCNPKSTTGRNALHTKVICGARFDEIPRGYEGSAWVVITPRSFNVIVHENEKLVQMRIASGTRAHLDSEALKSLNRTSPLTNSHEAKIEGGELLLDINCEVQAAFARYTGRPLDLGKRDLDPNDYFVKKPADERGVLYMDPGDFMLAPTRQSVNIPKNICAELVRYNPMNGEISTHDAGFIDPGFGLDDDSSVICEITNMGPAPIQLKNGRPIAAIRFEYLDDVPNQHYGDIGSSYKNQIGVRFAKQFDSLKWL